MQGPNFCDWYTFIIVGLPYASPEILLDLCTQEIIVLRCKKLTQCIGRIDDPPFDVCKFVYRWCVLGSFSRLLCIIKWGTINQGSDLINESRLLSIIKWGTINQGSDLINESRTQPITHSNHPYMSQGASLVYVGLVFISNINPPVKFDPILRHRWVDLDSLGGCALCFLCCPRFARGVKQCPRLFSREYQEILGMSHT